VCGPNSRPLIVFIVSEPRDPFDLAGQAADAEERAAKDKLEREAETEDWAWIMGEKRGRRIVWRLLERTGMYRTSFTGDNATFFNEGQRNIGLAIVARVMDAAPNAYGLMAGENS
jgi:hypothetical protein